MPLACFFSALCLLGGLVVNGPLVAQNHVTRPIPQPNPFPPGAAVYEWRYTCPHNNPDGTCRFSIAAANYSANNVADAQIVLAFQAVGSSQQIPFYYFWITSMGKKRPDFVMLRCRPESGWNFEWRILRSHEGIVAGGEVHSLIDGFCGERPPTIDLAHVDLP